MLKSVSNCVNVSSVAGFTLAPDVLSTPIISALSLATSASVSDAPSFIVTEPMFALFASIIAWNNIWFFRLVIYNPGPSFPVPV